MPGMHFARNPFVTPRSRSCDMMIFGTCRAECFGGSVWTIAHWPMIQSTSSARFIGIDFEWSMSPHFCNTNIAASLGAIPIIASSLELDDSTTTAIVLHRFRARRRFTVPSSESPSASAEMEHINQTAELSSLMLALMRPNICYNGFVPILVRHISSMALRGRMTMEYRTFKVSRTWSVPEVFTFWSDRLVSEATTSAIIWKTLE